jgi:acyl carrier protein
VNFVGARAAFLEDPGAGAPVPATAPAEAHPAAAMGVHVAPAPIDRELTPTQQAIVDAWRKVLGIKFVELHDSFLDLGGSSLTAVQVISRIEQTLGVRIAIEEFIFQTAGQLATLCDQKLRAAAATPATQTPPDEAVAAQGGGLLRSLRSAITGGRS